MFRVVRPSPAVIITAAAVLGTATFIAVPLLAQSLLAQNGEASKPGEAGKTESGKPEAAKSEAAAKGDPAKSDATKGEAVKGDQAKTEPAKTEPAKEAANTLAGPAARDECVWLGERVVGLMWKDDLDTAIRHLGLYDRFGCPGEHIRISFRCVVRQGNPQKDSKFDDRVHACWIDPSRPAEPATAAVEKPGTK
jgi:hypothetical protein